MKRYCRSIKQKSMVLTILVHCFSKLRVTEIRMVAINLTDRWLEMMQIVHHCANTANDIQKFSATMTYSHSIQDVRS